VDNLFGLADHVPPPGPAGVGTGPGDGGTGGPPGVFVGQFIDPTIRQLRMLHEYISTNDFDLSNQSRLAANPQDNVVAVVYNESNVGKERERKKTADAIKNAANKLGDIIIEEVPVHCPDYDMISIANHLEHDIGQRLKGILVIEDPGVVFNSADLVSFIHDSELRTQLAFGVANMWESVVPINGRGLVCFGPSREEAYITASQIAMSILVHGGYFGGQRLRSLPPKLQVSRQGAAAARLYVPAFLDGEPVTVVP
jgi:hypothetical protein